MHPLLARTSQDYDPVALSLFVKVLQVTFADDVRAIQGVPLQSCPERGPFADIYANVGGKKIALARVTCPMSSFMALPQILNINCCVYIIVLLLT